MSETLSMEFVTPAWVMRLNHSKITMPTNLSPNLLSLKVVRYSAPNGSTSRNAILITLSPDSNLISLLRAMNKFGNRTTKIPPHQLAISNPSTFLSMSLFPLAGISTYLYGILPDDEVIYMEQPEGFMTESKENWVCQLQCSLYGMKQSG